MSELDLPVLIKLTLLSGEHVRGLLWECAEGQNVESLAWGNSSKEQTIHINKRIFFLASISFSFFNDVLWVDLLLTLILSLCPGIFQMSCENW